MKSVTYFLVLFLALGCVLSSCSSEDTSIAPPSKPTGPLEAKNLSNISYGEDSDQAYDIYLPHGRTEETKILILIHGGGWTSGDKSDMNVFRDFLRDQLPDIAVVNLNYRLADGEHPPYPMQTDDITAVIRDLKNKRMEYQISDKLGFVGVSAGGHLSLLWSYALDTDNQVNMVCSVVGPTNLLDEAYLNTNNPELAEIMDNFDDNPDFLSEASPLFQVTALSPPTILFYGGQDPLIPTSQGTDLNEKLEELNVEHEFTLYPNGGHGWIGLDLLDTSVKLKAFIEKHL